MHIAFLTPEYPHEKTTKSAGLGTSTKNLVTVLVKKDIKVSVFVYGQSRDAIFSSKGITIHLLKHKKYKFMGWYLHRKYIQNYLNKIIEQEQITILEAPDWTGITAFMRFKIPVVIRFHGSDAYFCKLENRQQKRKNFWFEKLALKKATAYIAPTSFAGRETQKIFDLKNTNIKTIHYGVWLEKFINPTPHIYKKYTLLYIGTLIRKKGVLELAEIFNKVVLQNPHARLILIGSDAYDIKTRTPSTFKLMQDIFSEKAKEHVEYFGKVPYEDVLHHIQNAHVCVFPSFAETLGMVTIESMAMHKPVVNTSIGWGQELIDDGVNGYLVHPKKIDDYVDIILTLFNDKVLCLNIGKAARLQVEEKFNINVNVKKNISFYKSLIK